MKNYLSFFLLTLLPACSLRPVCITPGQQVQVKYTDDKGEHEETVLTGADFGNLPENGGRYQCMGRCGPGCEPSADEGPWLMSCMAHDICSFRNASQGFVFDAQCGDEAWTTVWDVARHRLFGCQVEHP